MKPRYAVSELVLSMGSPRRTVHMSEPVYDVDLKVPDGVASTDPAITQPTTGESIT